MTQVSIRLLENTNIALETYHKSKEEKLKEVKSKNIQLDYSDDSESSCDEMYNNYGILEVDMKNYTDSLAVPRYAETITRNDILNEIHCVVNENGFEKIQDEIVPRMRSILVRWIINIHSDFSLASDTLFNAVIYIDKYLAFKKVQKGKLQLLGAVCLWLASKVDELRAPLIQDFIDICNEPYTTREFRVLEIDVFKCLDLRLQYPSIKIFARRYLYIMSASTELTEITSFVVECCLLSHILCTYRPSIVAYTALILSVIALNEFFPSSKFKSYSRFSDFSQSEVIAPIIIQCINDVLTRKNGVTYSRYTDPRSTGGINRIKFTDDTIDKIKILNNCMT